MLSDVGPEISTGGGAKPEPIYATIYSVLRDHLQRNALPPGLVLGQANLARAFNVSKIPAGVALTKLLSEGFVHRFEGRGYIIPGGEPLRRDLTDAGLVLPAAVTAHTANRREQIYPEVEHAVAVCLAHGRFRLNETALAQHYDVSRTIAHEVLTQLERAGIIEQDSNNRWYAGPLSAAEFEHHYEMRWLLEPQALRQAFSFLDKSEVAARLRRLRNAASTPMQPPMLERLEADLHIDTLASCPNDILLNAVRRSQRVLIATHSTFAAYRTKEDISLMAMEHGAIYEALLDHDIEHATTVLEAHLRRALYPNLEVLRQLAPLPAGLRQPYLLEVK